MKNKKMMVSIIAMVLILFIATCSLGVYFTRNIKKPEEEVTKEGAKQQISKLVKKISPITSDPIKGKIEDLGTENLAESELDDIANHPLSVEGKGDINIEIFSSPEKAGTDPTDKWLIEVANDFNESNLEIAGKIGSVSIRNVNSGLAIDYIASGVYVPQAFSPSNMDWGDMLSAKGVEVTLKKERLAGNVAGILIKKEVFQRLEEEYGVLDLSSIVQAVVNNDLKMGYTNPYLSSSGLNCINSILLTLDEENPFSEKAKKGFNDFQTNIPMVAFTTMELRKSGLSGRIDALLIESQSLANLPQYNDYEFVPFGIRHDEPIYAIGELSSEENEVLDNFIDFCLNEKNQQLATKYGFNQYESYVCELPKLSGEQIIQAQALYKKQKYGNKEIKAVFVADTSESMKGDKMQKLKESLLNGMKYINEESNIGLISYNSKVYIDMPIGKFDLNQMSLFSGAVNNWQPYGNTAMYNAMITAANMLLEDKEDNAKLVMFLLTDGQPNKGVINLEKTLEIISSSDITIYPIAFGENADIDLLQNIGDINEAEVINANVDDVIYQIKTLFNVQM